MVSASRYEQGWLFAIGEHDRLITQCLWRLRDNERILLTVEDDGHQFGLPARVDAEIELNRILQGKLVTGYTADDCTGDLKFSFGDVTLEVISTSAGYESWQAMIDGKTIVGRGDGLIPFDEAK